MYALEFAILAIIASVLKLQPPRKDPRTIENSFLVLVKGKSHYVKLVDPDRQQFPTSVATVLTTSPLEPVVDIPAVQPIAAPTTQSPTVGVCCNAWQSSIDSGPGTLHIS